MMMPLQKKRSKIKIVKKTRAISRPILITVVAVIAFAALFSLLLFSDKFVGRAVFTRPILNDPAKSTQCSDGIDNDIDGFIDWGFASGNDKSCSSPFANSETDYAHTNIGWNDFPEFNLNPKLTTVYGGIQLAGCYQSSGICVDDVGLAPLRKGFSHIAIFEGLNQAQKDSIPINKRASMWVPFGTAADHPVRQQPLYKYYIPWNNNLELLNSAAKEGSFTYTADYFTDSKRKGIPNLDLFVADIEAHLTYDSEIINLRTNPEIIPLIPAPFRLDAPAPLTDAEFINQYKHDMAWMYNYINTIPKSNGFTGKAGSYGDVPLQIESGWPWYETTITWNDWISDQIFSKTCNTQDYNTPYRRSCANFLTFNFGEFMSRPGSSFFSLGDLTTKTDDVLVPSGYYWVKSGDTYGDQDWSSTGDNFMIHLFEIDANAAFSRGKTTIIFDWMRVHPSDQEYGIHGIDPWLAHTTAIFPYFTKNSGQWLWDWIGFDSSANEPRVNASYTSENRIAYDNFIYGLYRLSKYNQFFNGNYQVYHPVDARELFRMHSKIWRGVIKEDGAQMLVVAINPYADLNEITKYDITCPKSSKNTITYRSRCTEGKLLGQIQTIGQNTWLGVCNLNGGGCTGDQGGKDTISRR